jgi:hypothetical protein
MLRVDLERTATGPFLIVDTTYFGFDAEDSRAFTQPHKAEDHLLLRFENGQEILSFAPPFIACAASLG